MFGKNLFEVEVQVATKEQVNNRPVPCPPHTHES